MRQTRQKNMRVMALVAVICAFLAAPGQAADFSEGRFTVGTKFSDKFIYNNIDFMLPLFESPENASFFINPRVGIDFRIKGSSRNAERLSIGMGQRLFLPGEQFDGQTGSAFEKGMIIGWNANFDWQYSLYENFVSRVGLGGEMLSDWIDARLNAYVAITDDKSTGSRGKRRHTYGIGYYRSGEKLREIALSGLEGEVGGRLPVIDQLGEMRIFGGVYYFDAKRVSSVSGVTARFEWVPIPFVSVGLGWTSSNKLHGEHWHGELAFQLPFSVNALLSGYSPFNVDFTPKTGNIWHDRYTSPVRRANF